MKTIIRREPCGCTLFTDSEWGVLRSYQKCSFHKSESGKSGLAHHEVLGAIKDGAVQHKIYEEELLDPLNEMKVCLIEEAFSKDDPTCLEIGCGVGSYIPFLRAAGYRYVGVEPDLEAANLVSKNFQVFLYTCPYEEVPVGKTQWTHEPLYDLIFCAHAFEHMEDSPGMMAKAFSQLKEGGRLVLIIPNDDDPVNPDHLWFFNETSLRSTLMRIGFTDIRMAIRQRVKHEKFIYACASKL